MALKSRERSLGNSQQGIALVITLVLMLVIAFVGFGISVSARGSQRVGTAFKNQQIAFETAMAGLERAKENIRTQRFNSANAINFGSWLNTARNGGNLVASNTVAGFGATTNGFTNGTLNTPFLGPTALDGGSYLVFLTNDNGEPPPTGLLPVQNPADSNDTITLTSFGSGPNQVGFSAVQAIYDVPPALALPQLPALLTMPGRYINNDPTNPPDNFNLPSSNATMNGNGGGSPPACYPVIAVTSASNIAEAENAMKRDSNYTTCDPSSGATIDGAAAVDNFITGTNPFDGTTGHAPNFPIGGGICPPGATGGQNCLNYIAYLQGLVTQISGVAACVGNQATCAAAISQDPNNPSIVVIQGDLSMGGNTSYYGIMVVTGTLDIGGTAEFQGAAYVIGAGILSRHGGGHSSMCGGALVANINTPDASNSQLVGTPTFTFSGGGNSSFGTDSGCSKNLAGENIRFSKPMRRLSFRQIF